MSAVDTSSAQPSRLWMAALLCALMIGVALLGQWTQPGAHQQRSAPGEGFVLEREIPTSFGEWKLVPSVTTVITNPEIQEILDRVYSQVLSRTYVNAQGYRIMLSIAYGEDQRGGLQAHRPEVCYPAQGFALLSNELATVTTGAGTIAGRRLMTRLGNRTEPLTYWFSVGGKPVTGRLERRIEEMRLVLSGTAADGLLFRVSSVDADAQRGHAEQQRFVNDLLAALPTATRKKLSGL